MRLAQVMANLLANAAKYTDEGGQIWLDAGREGNDAVIHVRDNGIGIDAAALPRLFEMFAQIEGSERRSKGGLGIGLALARALVRTAGAAWTPAAMRTSSSRYRPTTCGGCSRGSLLARGARAVQVRQAVVDGGVEVDLVADELGERQGELDAVERDAVRVLADRELQLLLDLQQLGLQVRGNRRQDGAHTRRSRAVASPALPSPLPKAVLRCASARR